jgi:Phenazine biosynthesis-like protein
LLARRALMAIACLSIGELVVIRKVDGWTHHWKLVGQRHRAAPPSREFNFAETLDKAHTCQVRIFTPKTELPLAGHPRTLVSEVKRP